MSLDNQYVSRPCVRVLCLPDIDRAIGGVKQLYRHVEHLIALGWDASILTEAAGFRPTWFDSTAPTVSLPESWERGELNKNQVILVLPETYLGVDLSDFRGFNLSSLHRVVFNQNAYYTYSDFKSNTHQLLDSFYGNSLLLQVLSVSEDTHSFLFRNLSLPDIKLSRIVNAVEPIFNSGHTKSRRMHWMPRKNPQHVQAVLHGLQRGSIRNAKGWEGQPLQDLTHSQVAERLNEAQLFLAFGHPEGFGLPIAEAMAAGCWVVGYSGGGGKELFRYGGSEEVQFGDWSAFLLAIENALTRFAFAPRETQLQLDRQSLAIKTLYSLEEERKSIDIAWQRIYELFLNSGFSVPS